MISKNTNFEIVSRNNYLEFITLITLKFTFAN